MSPRTRSKVSATATSWDWVSHLSAVVLRSETSGPWRVPDPSETWGKENVIKALGAGGLQAGFEAWRHRDCVTWSELRSLSHLGPCDSQTGICIMNS